MIQKLIAAFMKPETSRLLLAALAVGWGVSTITAAVQAMQEQAEALSAELDAKAAQLTQLDELLRQRFADVTDEMPSAAAPFGSYYCEPCVARITTHDIYGHMAAAHGAVTSDDLDAWAAEHAEAGQA